uniref:Uncharacterized protein n=1 Tax=Setaria italica TaxID=4555 RepID=A0A0Q3RIK7_SETIT
MPPESAYGWNPGAAGGRPAPF